MWMLTTISETTKVSLGANFDLLFKHLDKSGNGKIESLDEFRGNIFGDIFTPFGIPDRPYEEILDKAKLIKAACEALDRYNEIADNVMNLVLFNFAIEHLLRIRRILKTEGGHALLVGVGGSGRQSLSRLATKMGDFEIFQIEIKKVYGKTEFREDLKSLFKTCGSKGEPTTFIFTDNSIKEESFLEDINNILNTGEVPNIFPADEKGDI
jgi:dynein heavy chain